ncbi:MAG: hypothetical protein ACLP8S_07960 [Solirubrobacteraceae bacterium]
MSSKREAESVPDARAEAEEPLESSGAWHARGRAYTSLERWCASSSAIPATFLNG